MNTRRKSATVRLWLLGIAVFVTAACGTRVSDERIEAASYLEGTEVALSDGAVSPGGSSNLGSTDTDTDAETNAETAATAGSDSDDSGTAVSGEGESDAAQDASGGTGAAAGQGAPTAASGPATGSEVAIGVIGTFSGPVGGFVNDYATGVQVWGRWVNENGGLNGHRVRVVIADDGGSPAGFNSRAQQLVEEEGVIAMALTTLGLAPGGNNAYLDSVGVPTFGTESGLNTPYENPNVLTATPSGRNYSESLFYGYAQAAKAKGVKKIAVLTCSDFSLCDIFNQAWTDPELQRAVGLEVVYSAQPSITTPDFTSICIDARNAGAEGIINGMDTASINRLADSCARQGYDPVLGVADLLANRSLLDNPNADGAVVANKMVAWFDTRVPGVVEMQEAFAEFAPGVELNGTLASGWMTARFLQEAAKDLPADNPTSADMVAGLAGLNGTTLGGLTYPLHFTPGQPSPRKTCYGSVVVADGKFALGPGEPLTCL